MQPLNEIIEKVENDYLKILVELLQNDEVEIDEAKRSTEEFLAMTPFTSIDDLQTKVKKFTEDHAEFGSLFIKLLNYEQEKDTHALIEEMRSHIRENRLDEALKLVDNKKNG